MNSGILGVNKASGMTSFDVIRIIKKKTGISKIGHGGTLDPMAEGVLPILINDGTAFFDALLNSSKKYLAVIQLGAFTETDDKESEIIETRSADHVTLELINQKISLLTGLISQIPPKYSALKVNGKRAYDLARKGEEVTLQPRTVNVYEWSNVSYDQEKQAITALIHCGSGTYIRSLARDLAALMNTAGHLSFLRRTMCGGISLENTINIEHFPENWQNALISPEQAVNFLPELIWDYDLNHLANGKPITHHYLKDQPTKQGLHRLMFQNRIVALVHIDGDKISYKKNFAPSMQLI